MLWSEDLHTVIWFRILEQALKIDFRQKVQGQDLLDMGPISPSTRAIVQSLSHVQLLATPWTAVCQVPLSSTISWLLSLFSCSVVSDSLRPHRLQHARLSFPSPSPGVCLNACLLNQWCHSTILFSVIPWSSCL